MRTLAILLSTALFAFLVAPGIASGNTEEQETKIDEARIYFGDSRNFEKPAQVNVDTVYMRIPEYQEIVRQKLTEKDAKYHMYMRTATDTFLAAVSAAASEHGYDLIGAPGAIVIKGKKVPDCTSQVIAKLPQ